MTGKTYKAIQSNVLSSRWEPRFVIISTETGEILDDAQGHGYKTAQKAYAAYGYKNRDHKGDTQKARKKRLVQKWAKEHKWFIERLEDDVFRIAKGSFAPDAKFDAKWVRDAFKQEGFNDLPFSAGEFLRYWQK